MRVQAVFPSLILLVAFYCCATPAAADPIVVTSGYVEGSFGPLGEPRHSDGLRLEGAGFTIRSSLEDVVANFELATPLNWTPGALVDLSGVLRVADPFDPFELFFDVPPTRFVCSSGDPFPRCNAVLPFTFHAELTFTPFGGVRGTHQLVGRGTAHFGATPFQGGGVTYIFEPVPEPATLSLVTTSALIAAAGVWRRRSAGARGVPQRQHL